MTDTKPPACRGRCARVLGRGVLLAIVFGLGFVSGQRSPSLPDLRARFTQTVAAIKVPPPRAPDEVRNKLAQAEGWVRTECDEKKQELDAAERTLFLLEQQGADKQALQKMRESVERTRREAETLRGRLAEIQAIHEQLRQADRAPLPAGQDDFEDLLSRARRAAEKHD